MAEMFAASSAGSVATDSIWDASGDLVVGTGANTASRLAVGASGYHLAVNSAGTGLEWLPHIYWVRANSNLNLPNDTNLNPLFAGASGLTAGSVTLPTGSYSYSGLIYITSMSTSIGNALISLIGAGTATMANAVIHAVGIDGSNPQNAGNQNGTITLGTATGSAVVAATSSGTLAISISGGFRITSSGSVIPSVQQANASAAVLQAGSRMEINYLGPHSVDHQGGWT